MEIQNYWLVDKKINKQKIIIQLVGKKHRTKQQTKHKNWMVKNKQNNKTIGW
jgi:hypothetical protein